MIWATVSSQSCFCWLYRAFPSLAAKNIINLITAPTIWWCLCVVFSCVVGRGCLPWPVCSLGKTLLAFALLHFVLQGQICLLLQVSLDFLLLHSSPLWWQGHPRRMGHCGEFWQNVVHWRREWQTTSVFLPWDPHEQYEKAKRCDTERWTPRPPR